MLVTPKPAAKDQTWIAYLSTFPPRECGIGNFTYDLTTAIDRWQSPNVLSKIVAMNPNEVSYYYYPKKVIWQISESRLEDYQQVAEKLNQTRQVSLVNVQHEFGIFGGDLGSHLLFFLRQLQKPVIITWHTVLPRPSLELAAVVKKISQLAVKLIVMTDEARNILIQDYGISREKISVIPHGIHHIPFRESRVMKSQVGLSRRLVVTTFGLLGRNKGIEYVLDALPEVVKRFPRLLYCVLGITHPVVLRQEGQSYRLELIRRVHELGLQSHVRFYNTYFSLPSLLRFLQASDIYISPSLDINQAVSGTLSYALGVGRPVISTAFAQARNLITPEAGILVDFKQPAAYSDALIKLLDDEKKRQQMGYNAYLKTRPMIWANVAQSYIDTFSPWLWISHSKKTLIIP